MRPAEFKRTFLALGGLTTLRVRFIANEPILRRNPILVSLENGAGSFKNYFAAEDARALGEALIAHADAVEGGA